jgi:putative transcriptional regulator
MLLDYANGTLSEPLALLVATHLALCPSCRDQVDDLEALGGEVLDELEPQPVSIDCLQGLLARLDEPDAPAPLLRRSDPESLRIPQPLRSYIFSCPETTIDNLPWSSFLSEDSKTPLDGVKFFPVPLNRRLEQTRLIRLSSGQLLPTNGLKGVEIFLVLEGELELGQLHFRRGDVLYWDCQENLRPRAPAESKGCLCLGITNTLLRLTELQAAHGRLLSDRRAALLEEAESE